VTGAVPSPRGAPPLVGPWTLPLILLAGAAVYVGCLNYELVWDDLSILRHQVFRDPQKLPALLTQDFRELTNRELDAPYYRPVMALSLAVDTWLWGPHPGLLRLTNLLLHLAATALVFAVAVAAGAGRLVAAVAALVFTLHPAHVEAVVFVSARDNLWVSVAALACLLAHRKAALPASRPRWGAIAIVLHLLALLSKEVAVVVPVLLILADGLCPPPHVRLPPAARWRWALRRALPYLGISLAVFASRLPAFLEISEGRLAPADLWRRLPGALETLARYLRVLIVPAFMHPHYPQTRPVSFLAAWPLAGLAMLIGAAALLGLAWRRAPAAALAGAWTLASLAPVVDLLPFSPRAMGLADRYLVLPSVGSSLLVAWLIGACLDPPAGAAPSPRRRLAGWAGLCAILAAFPALLLGYAPVWRDNLALFGRMAADAPNESLPLYRLGIAVMEAGDHPRAIRLLEDSLDFDPRLARVEAIRLQADFTRAALGLLYVLQGRAAEGFRLFDALRLSGRPDESYYIYRAKAHLFRGEADAAAAVAAEGLQRFPRRAELYEWLGRALDAGGKHREAAHQYSQALALVPDLPLVEEALGLSLMRGGDPGQAVRHLLRAADGMPERAQPRRALAVILEAQGRREASLAWWREVLALAPSGPAIREAAAAIRRLEGAGRVP
jgi:tetratricopeptide (TPR) repeat protein